LGIENEINILITDQLFTNYLSTPMMNSLPRQARICAALCHLAGLLWLMVGGFLLIRVSPAFQGAILALSLLLPCLTWLFTRRVHDFVDRAGREAVNAQLSILLYGCCALFVTALACGMKMNMYTATPLGAVLGAALFFIAPFVTMIYNMLAVVAAVQALRGNVLHYPWIIRFIPNP
jgi:uncharacterized Tic20 family protein